MALYFLRGEDTPTIPKSIRIYHSDPAQLDLGAMAQRTTSNSAHDKKRPKLYDEDSLKVLQIRCYQLAKK